MGNKNTNPISDPSQDPQELTGALNEVWDTLGSDSLNETIREGEVRAREASERAEELAARAAIESQVDDDPDALKILHGLQDEKDSLGLQAAAAVDNPELLADLSEQMHSLDARIRGLAEGTP